METPQVRVGIAVFVFKNGKFLIGKRKNAHGEGTWALPGGHLEFGETFEQTVVREVQEEVGLQIKNIRFGGVTNDQFEKEAKQYVTIWMLSDYDSGEASILEPHKCTEINWVDFDHLPSPLFLPWNQFLRSEFTDQIKVRATEKQKAP